MCRYSYPEFIGLVLISLAAGCSGGAAATATTYPAAEITPQPVLAANPAMAMSCVDGPVYRCSGNDIIRHDNGVALTQSGVQVYGSTTWFMQDALEIDSRIGGGRYNEHRKNRRGIVAFGDISHSSVMPVTGTAAYSGVAYGWYAGNAVEDAVFFRGAATAIVNFAARAVIVTLLDTVTDNGNATPVPVTLTAIAAMGAAGENEANYLTSPVDNGKLSGGLSGRYFGPMIATGSHNASPAEMGGAFWLTNATTGATAIGGFIASKQ